MNDLMQSYKRIGNLDNIDMYLMQGIYEKEPAEISDSEEHDIWQSETNQDSQHELIAKSPNRESMEMP